MFQEMLIKKMFAKQLQGVPQEMQDKLFAAIKKNPELFKKMAEEIQAEMTSGKDQRSAAMSVLPKYKDELQALL